MKTGTNATVVYRSSTAFKHSVLYSLCNLDNLEFSSNRLLSKSHRPLNVMKDLSATRKTLLYKISQQPNKNSLQTSNLDPNQRHNQKSTVLGDDRKEKQQWPIQYENKKGSYQSCSNICRHKNTDVQNPRLQTIVTHTIPVNSLKLMFPKTSQCLHDPKEQQQRNSSGIISAEFCRICPHLLPPILRIFRCLNPFEFFLQIPVKCISRTGMVIRWRASVPWRTMSFGSIYCLWRVPSAVFRPLHVPVVVRAGPLAAARGRTLPLLWSAMWSTWRVTPWAMMRTIAWSSVMVVRSWLVAITWARSTSRTSTSSVGVSLAVTVGMSIVPGTWPFLI